MRAGLGCVTAACAAVLIACTGSPTGTDRQPPRATHHLALCRPAAGDAWFAYQNDGGAWTTPEGNSFAVDATDKLTVAVARPYARLGGASGSLGIYRLTADQAQVMFDCAPHSTSFLYPNRWSGVVSGLRGDTAADVTAGIANGWRATAAHPTFTLGLMPDTAVDLLAVRVHQVGSAKWEPDVMIARPAQRYPDGATLPPIDFDSSEAFPLQRSVLTVSNVPTLFASGRYTPLQFQNQVRSATGEITMSAGALSPLDSRLSPASITTAIFAVPANRQWVPLTHSVRLSVWTDEIGPPTSEIWAIVYYHAAGDRRIVFPPELRAPTIGDEATSPFRRVRFDMPAQPEYDAAVDVIFYDSQNDSFELYATKEYFGGMPSVWTLSVPDLSRAPGFTSDWAPRAGPISWLLAARNQLGSAWKDGDVARQAALRGRK